MSWVGRIFVATNSLGVYYTNNFVDPTVQPIWTAINTGLAALDCREFHLDPFHQNDRQYVLIGSINTLYRRVSSGAWVAVCTPAILNALWGGTGSEISGFWLDTTIEGKIWLACYGNGAYRAAKSSDYGDTWVSDGAWYGGAQKYGLNSIRVSGNNIMVVDAVGIGVTRWVEYSGNGGATWAYKSFGGLQWNCHECYNPLYPTKVYVTGGSAFIGPLMSYILGAGAVVTLQANIGPHRGDAMWFHPTTALRQRLINDSKLYSTSDGWATINAPNVIDPVVVSFAPWIGDDIDNIIVGMTIGANNHVIGALSGESDVTGTGIAGTLAGTPPYTDSIPRTCGGTCLCGIQLTEVGNVKTHAVAMPDYLGLERGVIIPSDRTRVFVDGEPANPYPGIIWVEE